MSIPRFTANKSLYKNSRVYAAIAGVNSWSEVNSNEALAITPQGCGFWEGVSCYNRAKSCLDRWGDNYPCVMKCLGRDLVYECWDCITQEFTCTSSCSYTYCDPLGRDKNRECCPGLRCSPDGRCLNPEEVPR